MIFSTIGHRRSRRLTGYDYGQKGLYYITICTKGRECMLGAVENDHVTLNRRGQIVAEEWRRTATMRHFVYLDRFVIMPNHLHGIVEIWMPPEGTRQRAPKCERFGQPTENTLPSIVRGFKSAVTLRINRVRQTPGLPVWQRGYYDRVIRNAAELGRIRRYIGENPSRWLEDEHHPRNQ